MKNIQIAYIVFIILVIVLIISNDSSSLYVSSLAILICLYIIFNGIIKLSNLKKGTLISGKIIKITKFSRGDQELAVIDITYTYNKIEYHMEQTIIDKGYKVDDSMEIFISSDNDSIRVIKSKFEDETKIELIFGVIGIIIIVINFIHHT